MRRGSLLCFVLAGVLAGCAAIEDARWAQDPASARPGERTPSAEEVGLGSGSRLNIDRGLAIALTYNPVVAIGRARAEEAEARLQQVDSAYWPQIAVSADYKWLKSGGSGSVPTAGPTIGRNSGIGQDQGGGVTANQLLFDFGRTNALHRQAVDTFVAAQVDLKAAQVDVAFNLKQAFFTVLKQQELVSVATETVRQFEKHLEQVNAFIAAQKRIKYDLTKAQVDVGNAQLALQKAKTALRADKAILNSALGLAEDAPYEIDKPEAAREWTLGFQEALQEARQSHPRLVAQILRERAASGAIDAAIADLWPQLTLQGSYSWGGSLTPTTWLGSLGPVLNWVLFSGWLKTGRVNETVGALREARALRAQEEQQIFLDLRQAFVGLEDARERLKIATLTAQQAAESLDLAQNLYANGRIASVELTDAQVALANARSEQIQAQYDIEISVAALERAKGGIR